MKLCKDKDCLNFGIALNESEFPRNKANLTKGAKDGLGTYCKSCSARRTAEYRDRLQELRHTKVRIPESQLANLGWHR